MEHHFSVTGHVVLIFAAFAAFSVSFFFSLLFLAEHHFLKTKKLGRMFFRLPPLELTAKLNFLFLTIGILSMLAGVLLGAFLKRAETGTSMFSEATTWFSFLMLGLYAVILLVRIGPLERSRGVAYMTVISYGTLLWMFSAAHAGMMRVGQ